MAKYKATAYIRLSYTDDRSSESDSVSNQRKLIENFVERNPDIEVVSFKVDDGYSGIIFDRPAFKEMMQDVTNGEINCVIVKDLSRLGREYIETGRYLRKVFPAYGVRFIAITDNIDTAQENNGDDLTVSVKNIMNEAYCRDISVKTRTALDVKRRNGDFVGAFTVYGYMKSEENKNLLVPDPYASRVVKNIFQMRLEGSSALRIANELNRLGILSPLAYKKNHGLPYAKNGYAGSEDCKSLSLLELPQQAAERAELNEKIASRKQEIQRLRGLIRSLYENLIQDILTKDEYITCKGKYESRIQQLSEEVSHLEKGLKALDKQMEQHRALKRDSDSLRENRELTAALIDRLIDRVEVSKDKQITVRYRFESEFDSCEEVLNQCKNM